MWFDAYVFISKDAVSKDIDYIDMQFMAEVAKDGDRGYMVLPNNHLFYFDVQKDSVYEFKRNMMPVWGVKNEDNCFVAIVKSMSYDYYTVAERKNGIYYIYPRFVLDGDGMPEDILIEYTFFENADADYNDMAEVYRNYILDNKICIPLKERAKEREALEYAIEAPLIRIRNAWKPCPAQIWEQTIENEPPMHVACDFERVGDIIDELKKQEVGSAEISLVGWNIKGHDGRWPDAMPAEPALGGNEKLKEVIKKGQDNGYNMTCHTNSTDAYSIASTWDIENLIRNKDMSVGKSGMAWSGGYMYHLCSTPALKLAKQILPDVADLGFHGIHYIDVMSSVQPKKCYHPEHSLTKREVIENYRKIAELSTELFGGFSSEGGADYASPFLDYVLYVDTGTKVETEFNAKEIPFWQLVYHGFLLYNPFSESINYTIKSTETKLRFIEFGGRPSFYFHSRFLDESTGAMNWMGKNDLKTDDEHMSEAVKKIKEGYDEYKKLSYLQKEFMIRHEEIEENIYCVTYSDGSKIIVDYNKGEYKLLRNECL